ncbi:calcium-activated chloride channel regulator 4A-like [Antedon mediterranea]|uniref:calcium-activated chloride channel regulator 4A-like n=1 Tax=Antedon mediterranea TaxID=105859 RepID=UPI003AF9653C
MHLTPEYIQNSTINSQYGNLGTGRVLVHEWGHLRWGLGDEYPNLDHFYPSTKTKRIEGVRCSLDIVIEPLQTNHVDCQYSMDEINADNLNNINGFCLSYDDLVSTKALASIMYKPNILKSVTEFCHNDASRPGFHNYEAPNPHNEQCNYRSTWEVILETKDFVGGKNLPIETHVDTTPTFRLVQRIPTKIVILIEASERLNQGDYFLRVRQAVSYFVEQIVETGIHLGVVTFGVNITTNIVELSSKDIRENVTRSLPSVGEGSPDLVGGLNKALEQLSLSTDSKGASIIVISGGPTTADLSAITDELLNSGVTVDAVLYGNNIDNDLIDLVNTLQGVWFGFSGFQESCVLEDSLISILMERADIHKEIPKQIMSRKSEISTRQSDNDFVFVGSYLGKDLTFTVFFSSEDDFLDSKVYVRDPDGTPINVKDRSQYSINRELAIVTIKVSGMAKIGKWSYYIIYEGSKDSIIARINVISKVKSELLDQIVVNGQLMEKEIDYNKIKNQQLSVTIGEEYIFLIGASLGVKIDRPNAPPDTLFMLDLEVEFKGVYYDFTTDGVYTVSVEAYSEGDALKFGLTEDYGESSDVVPSGIAKRAKRHTEEQYTYLDPFTVSKVIGSFRVKNFKDQSVDIHPPSIFQIMEVKEDIGTYKQKEVTITWLSPGDNYFYGEASFYDIRVSLDFRQLIDNFESATQVTKDDIMSKSVTDINKPQLSNSVEELVIKVPLDIEKDSIVAIAIVAVDAAGNRGPRSNILSITFAKTNYLMIIIYVVIVLVAILALVGIVCYIRKRKKNSSPPVRYQVAKFKPEAV